MIEAKETLVGQISSNQNLSGELLPRGPKGDKGEKGDKGDKGDTGAKGADGKDGAIQYEAGENITIEGNVISATGGGGGENITIIDGNIYTENNPFNFDTSVIQYGDKFKFINAPAWFTINNKTPATNSYSESLQNLILEAINIPTNPTNDNPLKLYYQSFIYGVEPYTKDSYYYNYLNIYFTSGIGTKTSLTQRQGFTTSSNYEIYGEWLFYKIPKTYSDPTDKNEFTRKGYVDTLPTTYSGYDATKTQVLKNINGTLTWVDE